MPQRFVLRKQKWYPRPHDIQNSFITGLEETGGKDATIIPIIRYDEGQGDPNSYNANPEHPSFAISSGAGCYPESRVNNLKAMLEFSLNTQSLNVDSLIAVKVAYMVIALSFKEDYEASDEMSGLDIADILEMQKESTDRQGYPLYDGTDISTKFSGSTNLEASQPGLTTDAKLEYVDFNSENYYDALQYSTISRKLQSVQYGLKWILLTKERPVRRVKINIKRKAKKMNPYTQLAVLCYYPQVGTHEQIHWAGETSNVEHVTTHFQCRFNEWNQDFDMGRV